MFEVLKGFKDMAEFIKALKEYFELKNKVLWESSTSWSTGTKTITDISKYQTIQVWLYLGNSSMLMTRRGNLFIGGTSIGYPAWHATFYAELSLNGENVTIDGQYLSHNQSNNHGAITKTGIGKIIGITPMIPESLKKYLGGGVLKVPMFFLGGGCHAVFKEVFEGYFGRHKDFECEEQQVLQRVGTGIEQGKQFPYSMHFTIAKRNLSRIWKCRRKCRCRSIVTFNFSHKFSIRSEYINGSTGPFNHECRRWVSVVGIGRGYFRKREREADYLRILFRKLYIRWKATCHKAYMTDWRRCHA